jgi:hypothetical protein
MSPLLAADVDQRQPVLVTKDTSAGVIHQFTVMPNGCVEVRLQPNVPGLLHQVPLWNVTPLHRWIVLMWVIQPLQGTSVAAVRLLTVRIRNQPSPSLVDVVSPRRLTALMCVAEVTESGIPNNASLLVTELPTQIAIQTTNILSIDVQNGIGLNQIVSTGRRPWKPSWHILTTVPLITAGASLID